MFSFSHKKILLGIAVPVVSLAVGQLLATPPLSESARSPLPHPSQQPADSLAQRDTGVSGDRLGQALSDRLAASSSLAQVSVKASAQQQHADQHAHPSHLSVGAKQAEPSVLTAPARSQLHRPLFTSPSVQPGTDELLAPDPAVIRSRPVALDPQLLTAESQASAPSLRDIERLDLPLFDDVSFTAVRNRIEQRTPRNFTWIGQLEDVDDSLVTLVARDGIMVGNIRTPQSLYHIRYAGQDQQVQQHVIEEVDETALPPEMDPIPIDLPTATMLKEDAPAETSAPSTAAAVTSGAPIDIDVMVVYTPAARAGTGGTAAMQALIELAVSEANTAYANSNVNQRLRLVHAAEVTYTESNSFGTDLYHLMSDDEGAMDEVHALRDTYGADLVALLVESGNYCGLANVMRNPSPAFEAFGFSVTMRSCATWSYVFAHELGHNMGSDHDHNNSVIGAYSYSHGYQAPNADFRTVMAYQCPGGCRIIPYFSNPDIDYSGQPAGVADWADNTRSLNNTAQIVANFRSSVSQPGDPDILASPGRVDFGTVQQGSMDTQTLAFSNIGQATLSLSRLAMDGPQQSAFLVLNDQCSSRSLSPTDSCDVTVGFEPATSGSKAAMLMVPSNDPNTPVLDVALSGQAQANETVPPNEPALLDPFKRYQVRTARGTPKLPAQEVSLADALEQKTMRLSRAGAIANSVDVDGQGQLDPAAHFACYDLRDGRGQPKFVRQTLDVHDQLGSHSLSLTKADSLCVSSTQDGVASLAASDAYKCYSARTASGAPRFTKQEISVSDEFESKTMTLLKPESVCLPAELNGSPLLDPTTGLTCYQARDARGQPKFVRQDVVVEHTFGTEVLTVDKPESVCLPSSLD